MAKVVAATVLCLVAACGASPDARAPDHPGRSSAAVSADAPSTGSRWAKRVDELARPLVDQAIVKGLAIASSTSCTANARTVAVRRLPIRRSRSRR
jgi:hypothetical protein